MPKIKNRISLLMVLFMLTFQFLSIESYALDSTKIFVAGYFFKGETYRIQVNNKLYEIKCNRGADAFSFYVIHNDSLKDCEVLNVTIGRRARLGLKFKDTQTVMLYDDSREFMVLERSHRVKNRYSFEPVWVNSSFVIGTRKFWDKNDFTFDQRLKFIKSL